MDCKKIRGTTENLAALEKELGLRGRQKLHSVEEAVASILSGVREKGDEAVLSYTQKYDRAVLTPDGLRVSGWELEEARKSVSPRLIEVMEKSAANIRTFHDRQCETGYLPPIFP